MALTLAGARAETRGPFAHVYAQGDPKVSAPGKPWSKSCVRPSGLTEVEIGRPVGLTEVSGGRTQLLTPSLDGAITSRYLARIYVQGGPEVSAPGKTWRKS